MKNLLKACHTTYELKYHFVWIVKYRKGILFEEKIEKKLKEIIEQIGLKYWFKIIEVGSDGNHLHLFLQAAPGYSPARIAQIIKSITARELFNEFPKIREELWGGEFWGDGYFVRSVGTETTTESVKIYVKMQGEKSEHAPVNQLRLF